MPRAHFDSPYIFGIHESGGEQVMLDSARPGWVLFTEAIGSEADAADVDKPFGGVPIGVKSLNEVEGWPYDEASVPLRDRVGEITTTQVDRIERLGGSVLAAQTTSSEFGGVNLTHFLKHAGVALLGKRRSGRQGQAAHPDEVGVYLVQRIG